MLSILKSKRLKQEDSKEIENVKMISVPDIREYMIQGYKEIEQIKLEKESVEKSRDNFKEDANKFEKLYDATLVALNEFKKRDDENKTEIAKLKERLEAEQINRKADNKENKEVIDKLQEKTIILENQLKKQDNTTREKYKNEIKQLIKNTRGNLSKNKVLEIIENS